MGKKLRNIHYKTKIDLDFLLNLVSNTDHMVIHTDKCWIWSIFVSRCTIEEQVHNTYRNENIHSLVIYNENGSVALNLNFSDKTTQEVLFLETVKITTITLVDGDKSVVIEIVYPS